MHSTLYTNINNLRGAIPDPENYVQKGVVINRTLIQLVRDMRE